MRVLLVDDDQNFLKNMAQTLKDVGVVSDTTSEGEEGLAFLRLYDYDIVIHDLQLKDMDGYDLIRQIRDARILTPILVLSSVTDVAKKVRCFSQGADDYMTKPFEKEEFIARIKALIRRSCGYADAVIRVGNLAVDTNARTVCVDKVPIPLTPKEYRIVELLALRKGTTLSKEVFLNHLYGGIDEPADKIIDVFMCKLRKKISSSTSGTSFIETVWGRGYLLRDPEALASPMSASEAGWENREKIA